ncbi:unnamed protein product [Aureobasidium uvarum]|uniref:Uncharacterized protein n=1 Tax=Aureobasidium uvarum TaxID=2773716 RepID=A0A9N8PQ49_9PEZI|nr:unnamed protein product [Aureobasidium uvarum]
MVRRLSTTSTFTTQRVESNDGGKNDRTKSTNSATDVVIPSTLLNAITSGPYISHPNQFQSEDPRDTTNSFDVRQVAQQLHEETSRILDRSASISIAELARNTTSKTEHEFRKTSLEPNFGSTLKNQGLSPHHRDPGRHALSTVTEGKVTATQNRATTDDYFGNYSIGAQGPRLHRRTSSDRSVSRKARLNEPSPTSPSPLRLQSRNHSQSRDEIDIRISTQRSRRSTAGASRKESIVQRSASVVLETVENVKQAIRRRSIYDVYEKAKKRGVELQRSKWAMRLFEYTFYLILVAFVYFVLVGVPLWKGAVYWLYWVFDHKFAVAGTCAKIVGPTLEAALKIFPPSHIFVIANGNSPTPLDDTEVVCRPYGVNHVWSPVGSKIVAQFVGCYAARGFKNVLLIDDDCALPPNFPIVSDRMTPMIKCIGYTIKSVGPESSRGTLCQQAQDLEYKISGIQRALAGYVGSATFPHGAISLWDREFLIQTFYKHPGFSVSEDWFFGHVARQLGSRITMCTSVFIETETPNAVFFSSGGARGGFGEMTIFKQRFHRWNFFFVNGMYYNMAYILGSWKLGFWEIGAKLFVFQEVYETLLYLLSPFVLPISIIVRPAFFGYLFAGTFVLYFLNAIIFNELHLRLKKERVGSICVYLYYMPYKVVLTFVNVGSCYWSLYKYAQYFARRHPKIVEDEKAVDVVLRMEEQHDTLANEGRRMTITAVGAQTQGSVVERTPSGPTERKMTVTTLGPKLDIPDIHDVQPMSPVVEQPEQFAPAIRLQGERVSFSSRRSNSPGVQIERLPSHNSEGISPGQNLASPLSRTTTTEKLDSRSVDHRSRRSASTRSDPTRRSSSLPRSHISAEFESPGFEELMDRLAIIESRINPRNVSAVEVSIAEEVVPTAVTALAFLDYTNQVEISAGDEEEEEEEYEMYDLEKLDSGKTDESKSLV